MLVHQRKIEQKCLEEGMEETAVRSIDGAGKEEGQERVGIPRKRRPVTNWRMLSIIRTLETPCACTAAKPCTCKTQNPARS